MGRLALAVRVSIIVPAMAAIVQVGFGQFGVEQQISENACLNQVIPEGLREVVYGE
jgi:hypothetical protein